MEFYVLLKYMLFPLSHWKWVQLFLMVEGSSKQSDLFIKVRWPLIHVNIKKSSYQIYNYCNSYPPLTPVNMDFFIVSSPYFPYFNYIIQSTSPTPLTLLLLLSHQLLL